MKTITFFLFLAIPLSLIGQGKIDSIKKSTKSKSEQKSYYTSSSDNNNSNNYSVLGDVLLTVINMVPSESELTQMHGAPMRLQKYPYYSKGAGKTSRNMEGRTYFTSEFEANYIWESNNLQGGNIKARLNFSPKFSASVKGNFYKEQIENYSPDYLGTLHANASYHLFAYTGFDGWAGVGYSHLFVADDFSGWNINLGTEIYLFKPISLYTEWYFSFLDDDVSMVEGTVAMKLYINRFYFQGGYNELKVNDIRLSGPMLGIGLVL
ncbi:hypothetical protein [Flammeovirga pacifica]|uniref:Uncharacterized protein n=1 Tax=Flammeovirga pacifica TaxID=915059 RepID=A0A1S1YWA8_FLAPC|nr:hypothetical protein [Flammeovirga pacifica]OHX65095.1 hypothetical protein NH26_01375 [Flammeovirga pacifica]